jgi:hypothetical protein
VPNGVPLVVGDTGDRDCLGKLFSANRFDAVIHFAAFAEVGESMLQPANIFRTILARRSRFSKSTLPIMFRNLFFPRPVRSLVFPIPFRFWKRTPNVPQTRMANQNCKAKSCSSGFTALMACATRCCVTSMRPAPGTVTVNSTNRNRILCPMLCVLRLAAQLQYLFLEPIGDG